MTPRRLKTASAVSSESRPKTVRVSPPLQLQYPSPQSAWDAFLDGTKNNHEPKTSILDRPRGRSRPSHRNRQICQTRGWRRPRHHGRNHHSRHRRLRHQGQGRPGFLPPYRRIQGKGRRSGTHPRKLLPPGRPPDRKRNSDLPHGRSSPPTPLPQGLLL